MSLFVDFSDISRYNHNKNDLYLMVFGWKVIVDRSIKKDMPEDTHDLSSMLIGYFALRVQQRNYKENFNENYANQGNFSQNGQEVFCYMIMTTLSLCGKSCAILTYFIDIDFSERFLIFDSK